MKQTMAMVAIAGVMAASSALAESAAKGDPAKAQQIVTTVCAACHNADGNSISPSNPKLSGQHPEYLTKQLADFKSGERKSAIMAGMVAALSPEDMKNLGAYFGEKKISQGSAKDKNLVALGQKIYKGGNQASGVPACASCHGPNGAGIPVQFPALHSQHGEYTLAELKKFRSGERANDAAKMMRVIAAKMTDQEMAAVAEYIAGLN
ncbi:MAG: c-type cytochrome [Sulfurimicrobium sp.]|jgi:cytochrome c553|nr:c-type cytochrome [Sulfurimicrobium sp.]MDO9188604.1 c-type cytochrome [Sulfurimicrobium sp.]MDP1704313.1 c-type cytochrome [Sulfurimicrobium sp.]MDP1898105.1 c-type cytochrome [Sulfurimicrobium sp.]MDP2200142.1 c-type cytochrome [Sulfurimicrobium sp.]